MKLIEPIKKEELGSDFCCWTGNDNSNFLHSIAVKLQKTRDLELYWHKSKDDKPVFIGCYRMYPENLVAAGLCRIEKTGNVRTILHHRGSRIILSLV